MYSINFKLQCLKINLIDFFIVLLIPLFAIVINRKSNILNSPHTQYIGIEQNSRDDLERQA